MTTLSEWTAGAAWQSPRNDTYAEVVMRFDSVAKIALGIEDSADFCEKHGGKVTVVELTLTPAQARKLAAILREQPSVP